MGHIMISAAHKSSGKTTVSIGLCAALAARGHNVRPFKKGPDYIDPLWLGKASGNGCYNLDFYTMQPNEIVTTFAERSSPVDISIIEGNKGLYDGMELDGSNSNAALAKLINAPVVLVIDCQGITRGIAPLLLGYQQFDNEIVIAGVILNKVAGPRHETKLRQAVEHYTNLPVLGAIHRNRELTIEERHLGLVPSNEAGGAERKIESIANLVAAQVDLDAIIEIAANAKPLTAGTQQQPSATMDLRIGVARDAAFGFYYENDLDAMRAAGAEPIFFDTLNDKTLPDVDALFIGGGFPETHMAALETNSEMRSAIHAAIEADMPVYAECGGLMYLSRSLQWQGSTAEMVGAIPADTVMHPRPVGRGYVELEESGQGPWPLTNSDSQPGQFKGHEFHYSALENLPDGLNYAYNVLRGVGIDGTRDGIVYRNLLANYAHLRDTASNRWIGRFIEFVRRCKNSTAT
ncbi:cobyrinic acid a,c-diamide synthase [Solemya pervernicosa gill symbiont]|uniref:Cobyrinate a,c-diamide synthase n=2 Tax=Gammaproteobacteria incertae sedis TaxID=118884 RepID=A0A1T2L6F7_9GAMM|nr:cobyrinate a,c-diamide synthase [Candidatus Reidiella endopervernicosa]OOZ40689.1 cobyrinic acid a,c-diamide synthase [Solemya pervernicosa gill symbiont]QKQ26753.1 cobyrinate a,c-diamide synthase [Candidatus Reidiella endopervernicosa]